MQIIGETYITSLPPEFQPRQEWPEYAADLDMPPFFRPTVVGSHPRGMRRGIWPLVIEEYVGDTEPTDFTSDPKAPNRIIKWRRVTRQDIPQGWRALSSEPSGLEGYFDLALYPAYASRWVKVARYDRKQWLELRDTTHTIEKISWSEYAQAFKKSTIRKKIGLDAVRMMERKSKAHPEHVIFWGVRDTRTAAVVAGVGVINSPANQASYYATGFMHKVPATDPLMVGLMDHWFQTSKSQNIRFLHFGQFWKPGEPQGWRGFSTFKRKFNPQFILYPPTLYRFKHGTLF